MNFTIINTRLIIFGLGVSVNEIAVKCNNCGGKFSMIRRLELLDGITTKVEYEYKHCPHCGKELKDDE